MRLPSTNDDDDDSKFSFGLIHTISAAIGVGALSYLTCIAMILVVRRKKHRKTTGAVEDEKRARRWEAEQLAYEQECAEMNTNWGIVLLRGRYYGYQKHFPDQELGYRERYAGDTSVLDDAAGRVGSFALVRL